jgi:LytS/YehU family sensor histidine kinase
MISDTNLNIEILDNGKGFYPSTKRNNSFGLKNIKLVIQKLQLKYKKTTDFKILNRLDESGTKVIILLPLITQTND